MEQLLQNCLHNNPARFPFQELQSKKVEEWDLFIGLAATHRVDTILFFNITNYLSSSGILMQDLSDEFRESIDKLFKKTGTITRYNLRLFSELQSILKRLKVEKIPVIVLKGAYLAHEVYPGLGMREMDDIDLMFQKKDLALVYTIFKELGYKPRTPLKIDSIEAVAIEKHSIVDFIKNDCTMEVHWNIVSPFDVTYIDPEQLWDKAKNIKITNQPALVFCANDFLLHLCHNFSYHHVFGFGLRPVYDILAFLEHSSASVDWKQVVERATSFGWQKGVWLSLILAKNLYGANVPGEMLEKLNDQPGDAAIVDLAQKQLYADQEVLAVLKNMDRISEGEPTGTESEGLGDRFRTVLKQFIKPEQTKDKKAKTKTKVSSEKKPLLADAANRRETLTDWLLSVKY